MNRSQLENIYYVNGLGNFQLNNIGDLMKVHGINARTVKGYSNLNDKDKEYYLKFIIKFMNCMGLEKRMYFEPLRIYKAQVIEYLLNEEDETFLIGEEVWDVTNPLKKIKVREWIDEEELENNCYEKRVGDAYLRIDYKIDNRAEWLHIINEGHEWY